MNRNNLRSRYLQPDLAAAGLPRLTMHELRHTFASVALYEWSWPPAVVQQILGHESIRMTMDLYGHLVPGSQEAAIRALRSMRKNGGDGRVTVKQGQHTA